jgi:hypothetical protein
MSKEFEDYYNGIVEMVKSKLPNPKYADNLSRKNYFRIKTGFYEDEPPTDVVKDVLFSVNETIINRNINESLILERSITDEPTRKVIRDITNIIKTGIKGKYYLPEDVNQDKMLYDFKKLPLFAVEFLLEYDASLSDDYLIDGETFEDEDGTIFLYLIINPSKYPQSLYDIIGDLNETFRHELEHVLQDAGRRPDEEVYMGGEQPQDKTYYLQPHEIPAEIRGFRRLVKLRKQEPREVIKSWFVRNKSIHKLSDEDINELVDTLTKKYEEYYG